MILTLLGTVFRYGKRIGLMRDKPVADVKKPGSEEPVYTLEVEEIARLRAALDVPERAAARRACDHDGAAVG